MIASNAYGMPNSGWTGAARMTDATKGMHGAWAVHLIDRRTGAPHRVNGTPLVIFTRRPDEAAADLLEGRDPAVWEARIKPIGKETR